MSDIAALNQTVYVSCFCNTVNTNWQLVKGGLTFSHVVARSIQCVLNTHTHTPQTHVVFTTSTTVQAGFAMIEAGTVKSVNVRNVLFKNIADACLGGLIFWLLGYGFAYGGGDDSSFIGDSSSGGEYSFAFRVDIDNTSRSDQGYAWITFFFQYAFAAAATTIVSGAVAEEQTPRVCIVLITGFIYPVVVHWVWDTEGWILLSIQTPLRRYDRFCRKWSYVLGGIAALVGAIAVGPRTDARCRRAQCCQFSSAPLQVLEFILFVGWFGSIAVVRLELTDTVQTWQSCCDDNFCAVSEDFQLQRCKFVNDKWDLGRCAMVSLLVLSRSLPVAPLWRVGQCLISLSEDGYFGASRTLCLQIDDPLMPLPCTVLAEHGDVSLSDSFVPLITRTTRRDTTGCSTVEVLCWVCRFLEF